MNLLSNNIYRLAIAVLLLWLAVWIGISWAGVQDDAFIHLRYAGNLLHTHLITYDGVHPNYGASSLLYVYLLAPLRALTHSPNLPRLVSSLAHVLLIASLGILFLRTFPREATASRVLSLALLVELVSPSAVRWLDDGMETGIVLCFVALLCWVIFQQTSRTAITLPHYLACVVLGFFTVLLRLELILVCGVGFAVIGWTAIFPRKDASAPKRSLASIFHGSHLLLGGLLAMVFILVRMHVLVPDTALAKSTGVPDWHYAFQASTEVLAGALSFGAGMLLLWALTLLLLLFSGRFSMPDLFANLVFPVLFALAGARGQQIQGARYFVWAIFFSTLWNVLQLTRVPHAPAQRAWAPRLAYCFLALLLLGQPLEARTMYPMLRERAALLHHFEDDHLDYFKGKLGVAYDIGFIGYFTQADICDVAGLVNGRDNARMTVDERGEACWARHPDFLFLNQLGIDSFNRRYPLSDWQVCTFYDFKNVTSNDRHYLVVRREDAREACQVVAHSSPYDIDQLPK